MRRALVGWRGLMKAIANYSRIGRRKVAGAVGLLVVALLLALPLKALAQTKTDLTLILTPNASSIDVQAGKDSREVLEVRNTGAAFLTNVTLSVEKPPGWAVSLDPSQIGSLQPDAATSVSVVIRPPSSVTKGEYWVSFTAVSDGLQRIASLQVRVQPASYWIWVVAGIAAVVVAVFVAVFMRTGRRG